MAFNRRNWKGRQGTGLNKFSINGATPVTVVNQPDSITEQGDALSAGNLNDLEQRIADGFDSASGELADAVEELESADNDLKSAIQANSNRISNLEQKAGGYSVVNYRGTNSVPTGKAKYGLVESIVGKSRAWNRLIDSSVLKSQTYANVVFSVTADGELQLSGLANESTPIQIVTNDVDEAVVGHKYLLLGGSSTFNIRPSDTLDWDTGAGVIFTAQSAYSLRLAGNIVSGTNYSEKHHVFCRDLTLIFPEGVPSTVAECVQKCPDILKWDAYGYSLVDTTVEGVEARGFNLFNKADIVENYLQDPSSSVYAYGFGHSNYIPIQQGTDYYIKSHEGISGWYTILWYDSSKNYLAKDAGATTNLVVSAPIGACYAIVNFQMQYIDEVCLSISGSLNGTYKPYVAPSTLSLPTPVTLRSAGSVADTDELNVEVNGVDKRRTTIRVGEVDMGEISMSYNSARSYFSITLDSILPIGSESASRLMNTYYEVINKNYSGAMGGVPDKTICQSADSSGSTKQIYIKDTSKTDADLVSTKAPWLSGYKLYFALETPTATLSDPIINNTILTEGGGTINTIQTQTPVIDNSMDVGYLALGA